jgi:hypothetical protein
MCLFRANLARNLVFEELLCSMNLIDLSQHLRVAHCFLFHSLQSMLMKKYQAQA